MKGSTKAKGGMKNVPFIPMLFVATVAARKATGKDLDDVKAHENDPIERRDHRTMGDTIADL
jgi:hypothetical protein